MLCLFYHSKIKRFLKILVITEFYFKFLSSSTPPQHFLWVPYYGEHCWVLSAPILPFSELTSPPFPASFTLSPCPKGCQSLGSTRKCALDLGWQIEYFPWEWTRDDSQWTNQNCTRDFFRNHCNRQFLTPWNRCLSLSCELLLAILLSQWNSLFKNEANTGENKTQELGKDQRVLMTLF